jgi:hypothetical protein
VIFEVAMPNIFRYLSSFDRVLNHDEIDEFLVHLNSSINKQINNLDNEYDCLSVDQFEDPRDIVSYKDHLADLLWSANNVRLLGNELTIIALYKKVERQIGRIVKKRLGISSDINLAYFEKLRNVLPFEIKGIEGFVDFNELRLINNAIKHEGKVSRQLANEYPSWKYGELFSSLDDAYRRLLPGVKRFVADLVDKLDAS